MNVHLTEKLEKLVQSKVDSGRYNSASEVVREALRLMEERDEVRALQLQHLRGRMDKGLAEAKGGRLADGETFMKDLIKSLNTRATKRKTG